MGLLFGTAAAVFALDRATKILVVEVMDLATRLEIPVLPPFLTLRMAWNTGINFGLFGSSGAATRWALIALAVAISMALAVWARQAGGRRVPIAAGLVIGGAIGNVWDRLQYGAVADFLNMSCCGIRNPFAFNVADIAIFLGAVALVLLTGDREKGT